ncbi:Imm7 family immunity protein [Deinococcus koreensis]|uniref:Uncharacterized protein n=1 Tax=Deinococcus koreensis TaxID=2054903 RepID=A0A2K3UZ09_9DEIO|nr:hypothetical protein CVO96_10620 [Deinococcus koreensis]
MFEFHGWFNIRESPQWPGENSRENEIFGGLERLTGGFQWTVNNSSHHVQSDQNAVLDIGYMNGSCFIHLRGHKNHRSSYWDDIQTLLEWICREAPGSFGLLYWRDDEGDPPAEANNFQVIVMARGELTTRFDPFLSPTIPTIEDEWDGIS